MALSIDLRPSTALVTGAGQGVGRALALALSEAGAVVAVNDVRPERAAAVAGEICESGGTAEAAAFDVTDWDAVQRAVAGLVGVDILVNNAGNAGTAGWGRRVAFADTDPRDWEPFLGANLYGVMHCTRAVLPTMIRSGGGRIITIVSEAGRFGDAYLAPYAAAKAGAAGFCRSVAREVGRHGITVNCISLGTIRTPATAGLDVLDEDARRERLGQYVIRRFGEPEDVAGLATYLASPLGSWITGQTYAVNGGYTMSL